MDGLDVPIFINSRDRVTDLRDLVAWLDRSGHRRIIIVDNDSTYPPLLEYLAASPHQVERLSENLGPRAPWSSGLVASIAGSEPYVVTDPDVVPDDTCPADAVGYFLELLERYPRHCKVGFGLHIDDIPDHYADAESVRKWEAKFWQRPLRRNVFQANIDTTFAAYRVPEFSGYGPAIRTGHPYMARHRPWYVDSSDISEEQAYYEARAEHGINTWSGTSRANVARKQYGPLTSRQKLHWRYRVLTRQY